MSSSSPVGTAAGLESAASAVLEKLKGRGALDKLRKAVEARLPRSESEEKRSEEVKQRVDGFLRDAKKVALTGDKRKDLFEQARKAVLTEEFATSVREDVSEAVTGGDSEWLREMFQKEVAIAKAAEEDKKVALEAKKKGNEGKGRASGKGTTSSKSGQQAFLNSVMGIGQFRKPSLNDKTGSGPAQRKTLSKGRVEGRENPKGKRELSSTPRELGEKRSLALAETMRATKSPSPTPDEPLSSSGNSSSAVNVRAKSLKGKASEGDARSKVSTIGVANERPTGLTAVKSINAKESAGIEGASVSPSMDTETSRIGKHQAEMVIVKSATPKASETDQKSILSSAPRQSSPSIGNAERDKGYAAGERHGSSETPQVQKLCLPREESDLLAHRNSQTLMAYQRKANSHADSKKQEEDDKEAYTEARSARGKENTPESSLSPRIRELERSRKTVGSNVRSACNPKEDKDHGNQKRHIPDNDEGESGTPRAKGLPKKDVKEAVASQAAQVQQPQRAYPKQSSNQVKERPLSRASSEERKRSAAKRKSSLSRANPTSEDEDMSLKGKKSPTVRVGTLSSSQDSRRSSGSSPIGSAAGAMGRGATSARRSTDSKPAELVGETSDLKKKKKKKKKERNGSSSKLGQLRSMLERHEPKEKKITKSRNKSRDQSVAKSPKEASQDSLKSAERESSRNLVANKISTRDKSNKANRDGDDHAQRRERSRAKSAKSVETVRNASDHSAAEEELSQPAGSSPKAERVHSGRRFRSVREQGTVQGESVGTEGTAEDVAEPQSPGTEHRKTSRRKDSNKHRKEGSHKRARAEEPPETPNMSGNDTEERASSRSRSRDTSPESKRRRVEKEESDLGVPEDFDEQKKILAALQDLLTRDYAYPFSKPVDPKDEGCSNYLQEIKNPMDLGTISKRLKRATRERGFYQNAAQVMEDIELVWANCNQFNGHYDPVCYDGRSCQSALPLLMERHGVSAKTLTKRPARRLRGKTTKRRYEEEEEPVQKKPTKKRKKAADDANDGRLIGQTLIVFASLDGKVKSWKHADVTGYNEDTCTYSVKWTESGKTTRKATFGNGCMFPVYRCQ